MSKINYFMPYVILLVLLHLFFTPTLVYRVRANNRQELTCIRLLHLILQGSILRNSARLMQNFVYLVKNLLIISNLKALLVYGSPYIKKLSTSLQGIHIFAVFLDKSMSAINHSFRCFSCHGQLFFVSY